MLAYNLRLINEPLVPTYYSHNGSSTIELVFVNEQIPDISNIEIREHTMTKHCQVCKTIPLQLAKNSQRNQPVFKCEPLTLSEQFNNVPNSLVDENDIDDISNLITKALQHSSFTEKRGLSHYSPPIMVYVP